jgi:hypothetical protein
MYCTETARLGIWLSAETLLEAGKMSGKKTCSSFIWWWKYNGIVKCMSSLVPLSASLPFSGCPQDIYAVAVEEQRQFVKTMSVSMMKNTSGHFNILLQVLDEGRFDRWQERLHLKARYLMATFKDIHKSNYSGWNLIFERVWSLVTSKGRGSWLFKEKQTSLIEFK